MFNNNHNNNSNNNHNRNNKVKINLMNNNNHNSNNNIYNRNSNVIIIIIVIINHNNNVIIIIIVLIHGLHCKFVITFGPDKQIAKNQLNFSLSLKQNGVIFEKFCVEYFISLVLSKMIYRILSICFFQNKVSFA